MGIYYSLTAEQRKVRTVVLNCLLTKDLVDYEDIETEIKESFSYFYHDDKIWKSIDYFYRMPICFRAAYIKLKCSKFISAYLMTESVPLRLCFDENTPNSAYSHSTGGMVFGHPTHIFLTSPEVQYRIAVIILRFLSLEGWYNQNYRREYVPVAEIARCGYLLSQKYILEGPCEDVETLVSGKHWGPGREILGELYYDKEERRKIPRYIAEFLAENGYTKHAREIYSQLYSNFGCACDSDRLYKLKETPVVPEGILVELL